MRILLLFSCMFLLQTNAFAQLEDYFLGKWIVSEEIYGESRTRIWNFLENGALHIQRTTTSHVEKDWQYQVLPNDLKIWNKSPNTLDTIRIPIRTDLKSSYFSGSFFLDNSVKNFEFVRKTAIQEVAQPLDFNLSKYEDHIFKITSSRHSFVQQYALIHTSYRKYAAFRVSGYCRRRISTKVSTNQYLTILTIKDLPRIQVLAATDSTIWGISLENAKDTIKISRINLPNTITAQLQYPLRLREVYQNFKKPYQKPKNVISVGMNAIIFQDTSRGLFIINNKKYIMRWAPVYNDIIRLNIYDFEEKGDEFEIEYAHNEVDERNKNGIGYPDRRLYLQIRRGKNGELMAIPLDCSGFYHYRE